MAATSHSARIGMVNFLNTAPLYEIWKRTVSRPDWQVTEAPPSTLNRLLHQGALDLGFISSHEYALHPEEYKILGNLSISATGKVGSVFLFSRVPPMELDGRLVLLSSQSQTSVNLIKIILEKFYRVQPRYETGLATERSDLSGIDAVLSIGDEALLLASEGRYPYQLDLGEAWQRETGLPFVFAVWAVREEFCRNEPDQMVAIHHELLRCLDEGRQSLMEISRIVAPRIPMPVEACFSYLSGMEYDLDNRKQEGLTLFYRYLIERGEASPAAVPLKICG
jgi:chorismate dehydratase